MNEKELFKKAQEGEKKSRDILFEKNTGLIHHVMKRFLARGLDTDDLYQIGSIGLLKAIDKFDTEYGVCFSTYAVPLIMGEIQRFFRDDGIIKISRGIKDNQRNVNGYREKYIQKYGQEPSINEISKETGISVEDIVIALEAGREVESLYKTMYESEGNEVYLMDMLGEEGKIDKVENKLLIESLLGQLGEVEKSLIKLRFFDNFTQTQVAGELGISQVQVSRMEKKVLMQMRKCVI